MASALVSGSALASASGSGRRQVADRLVADPSASVAPATGSAPNPRRLGSSLAAGDGATDGAATSVSSVNPLASATEGAEAVAPPRLPPRRREADSAPDSTSSSPCRPRPRRAPRAPLRQRGAAVGFDVQQRRALGRGVACSLPPISGRPGSGTVGRVDAVCAGSRDVAGGSLGRRNHSPTGAVAACNGGMSRIGDRESKTRGG